MPTFHVTTINLTPDLRTAAPNLGSCDFGDLEQDQLLAILENFCLIDPVQNHDAEPHIVVEVPGAKFRIRTGQGKFFLYNARDAAEAYVEMDADAIVREVSQQRVEEPGIELLEPVATTKTPHNGIAVTILAAGLLLNGYTLYSVFYIDDVNKKPPIELVTNPTELTALQLSVVGRYATGNSPGDRVIVVGADGRVRFLKIVQSGERADSDDSYRIGRHDGKLCLTMPDSGIIDVTNIETIVYFRDIYHRTK